MRNIRAFILVPFLLIIPLSSCEQKGSGEIEEQSISALNVAIPRSIVQAALPSTGTLRVHLYIDSETTPIAENLNVDISAPTVTLEARVNPGNHNFTLKFSYNDPVFGGPWDLTTASKSLNVIEHEANPLDFDSPYFYLDTDNDGKTNLTELDESVRTNPGDATCIFNKSVIGGVSTAGCTLG